MKAIWGLILGILISLSLAAFAGENPWTVFLVLAKSAFGSPYDLGLALFYTTSLIFTGLSVSIAFHSGLFNIGAEGQLTVGTLAATWFGLSFPEMPPMLAPILISLVGILAGALWGLIPGWLKAYRGSHEVIVTMMMNFIAAAIASYVTLNMIRAEDSQNPESRLLPDNYLFKGYDFVQKWLQDSPANLSLLLAIALSFAVYFLLYRSVWGYEIRVAGQNEKAAQIAGIEPKKIKMLAMLLAGALAGCVAVNEVLGSSGRFKMGFSPDYGFVGIAVALLARNHPLGILASAFLFGVLQKGATDLDVETEFITRDFARIIQAILIFSVASIYFWDGRKLWKRKAQ
jgi:general nucleoside transport system permease protein